MFDIGPVPVFNLYRITLAEANRVRRDLGLPDLAETSENESLD